MGAPAPSLPHMGIFAQSARFVCLFFSPVKTVKKCKWDFGETSPTVLAKFPHFPIFFNGEHLKNVTIPFHHLPHLAQMPHHPHTSIAFAHSLPPPSIAHSLETPGPALARVRRAGRIGAGVMICDIKEDENCKEQTHDDNCRKARGHVCVGRRNNNTLILSLQCI